MIMNNMKKDETIANVIYFLLMLLLKALCIMLLWNGLGPQIFHLGQINYGQALWLWLLVDMFRKITNLNEK